MHEFRARLGIGPNITESLKSVFEPNANSSLECSLTTWRKRAIIKACFVCPFLLFFGRKFEDGEGRTREQYMFLCWRGFNIRALVKRYE
jgi:hypothetical protein